MRSIAAGIYVAIFISFLRKILGKASGTLSRRAKFGKLSKGFRGYAIVIEVQWDTGICDPHTKYSWSPFIFLPSWVNEQDAMAVASTLNNPSHRIMGEATINSSLNHNEYRCTRIHFGARTISSLSGLMRVDMPAPIDSAISLLKCDLESEVTDLLEAMSEEREDADSRN